MSILKLIQDVFKINFQAMENGCVGIWGYEGLIELGSDEVAELCEQLLEMAGLGWQPIETAPKDGTIVDLWVVDHFGDGWREANAWYVCEGVERAGWVAEGHGDFGSAGLCDEPEHTFGGVVRFTKPTHWRPLPQTPKVTP